MKRIKTVGVALSAIALTLLAPSAAHAGRSLNADPEGDVWRNGETLAPAGIGTNVDLHVTDVRHGRNAVTVKATYYELKKTGNDFIFVFYSQYRENGETEYLRVDIVAGPGRRSGESLLSRPLDKPEVCEGLTNSVDYSADTVSLRIPRECFENPRWIRFVAEAAKRYPETSETEAGTYSDDARSAGTFEGGYSSYLSERIYRQGASARH